jgi:hypothetical protein
MRPLFVLFTSSLLLAQPPARVQTGYDSIRASNLKADLTFLSSDALEGRRSLERGSEVAIQWIASEFAKAGLKPGAGDSYLQTVPIIEFTPDRDLTTITVTHQGKSETLRAPDITSAFSNEVSGQGAIVFAGFGITAPELNYDDYAGIDAKGKIVLVFNHEPQEADDNSVFNGKGNTRYTNNNYKLFNAQKHGAIALITMPDPGHFGPQRGAPGAGGGRGRGQQGAAALRPRIPTEALAEGGPSIPLFTISESAARSLLDISGKKAADLQTAIDAKLIPASFEIPATRVSFQTATSERRRANSYNVVGLLEGSAPSLKAETVIFSGHFDHDGMGPSAW